LLVLGKPERLAAFRDRTDEDVEQLFQHHQFRIVNGQEALRGLACRDRLRGGFAELFL
jgi:predicted solute-binding protein